MLRYKAELQIDKKIAKNCKTITEFQISRHFQNPGIVKIGLTTFLQKSFRLEWLIQMRLVNWGERRENVGRRVRQITLSQIEWRNVRRAK